MVTVGSILGGTFRFVRANLPSIAIWMILSLVLGIVMRLAMAPIYDAQLANLAAAAQGLPPTIPPLGSFFLVFAAMTVFMLVIYNAVFRAVLFPQDRTAAYLRLGMDELRLLGLMAALFGAFFIVMLVFGIVVGIVGAIVGVALGAGRGGAVGIVFLIFAVVWAAMIFVSIRLSVAAPLTLQRRRIVIGPAWRLTKGRFWTLFGAYLVVALGLFVLMLILMLPTMGPMIAAMTHPGDPDAARRMAEAQAQQMRLDLTAGGVLWLILNGLIGGVVLAFVGGLPAVATAQLLDEKAGLL